MRDFKVLAKYFSVPVVPVKRKPDPTVLSARGRSGAAMRKVKTLLAAYPQINVERDMTGGYWVTCDAYDPEDESDPLYDQHFAVNGEEVLEAVNVYVEALNK